MRTLDERLNILIRGKSISSSERVLHKDYDRKGSLKKMALVVSLKGFDAKTD
jgi:hypothetical protein